MSAPFPNVYHHRRVAESTAKACDVCYKPSTSVLITPDSKDFFFICPLHLRDQYFCTPRIDQDALKAKRERELEEEKERVKKEYEERLRKRKDKESKEKDKDKKKGDDADKEKDKEATEKEDSKNADKNKKRDESTPEPEEPRIFELKSAFYNQRLMKKRQAEAAKRDRGRASQPGYFPSVPTDLPGR